MKNLIIPFAIIFNLTLLVNAQEKHSSKYLGSSMTIHILAKENCAPMFCQYIIARQIDVDSIKRLTAIQTRERFGEEFVAKYGSVVMYSKSNIKYLNIDQLLNLYKISEEDRKLPIYIDYREFKKPVIVLVVKDEIYNIEVINLEKKDTTGNIISNQKIIHVVTNTGNNISIERAKPANRIKSVIDDF